MKFKADFIAVMLKKKKKIHAVFVVNIENVCSYEFCVGKLN